jgi:Arc/MetJ-type ribon-helix-helix transcriptional regulator
VVWVPKKEVVFWSLEIPKHLDELVEKAVEQGWYRTKAELVRTAVRRELERIGLLK